MLFERMWTVFLIPHPTCGEGGGPGWCQGLRLPGEQWVRDSCFLLNSVQEVPMRTGTNPAHWS